VVIRLEDVSVAYRGRTVPAGVTARIAERRVAVIGASGSGKSTFARLLNGLVTPDGGLVEVDGLDTVLLVVIGMPVLSGGRGAWASSRDRPAGSS
jgi:ABC-type bacteriocin/lantibiotic exporter with double-glycine peptidase domain